MKKCDYCGKVVGNSGALHQHEKHCDSNPGKEDQSFSCLDCGGSFESEPGLISHRKWKHGTDDEFPKRVGSENLVCEYGCGQEANFRFSNGCVCCSRSHNQCSMMRKGNSDGIKISIKEGYKPGENLSNRSSSSFKSTPIDEGASKECEYGCGKAARYVFSNGKFCCSKHFASCPQVRKKNSLKGRSNLSEVDKKYLMSLQVPLKEFKRLAREMNADYAALTCPTCDTNFIAMEGRKFCSKECARCMKHKDSEDEKAYRYACSFNFNVWDYPSEFNLDLIREHGWYQAANRGHNLNGVTRDHMISISDGWERSIDPKFISHPANCQLMLFSENSSKHGNSSISLEELKARIGRWKKTWD